MKCRDDSIILSELLSNFDLMLFIKQQQRINSIIISVLEEFNGLNTTRAKRAKTVRGIIEQNLKHLQQYMYFIVNTYSRNIFSETYPAFMRIFAKFNQTKYPSKLMSDQDLSDLLEDLNNAKLLASILQDLFNEGHKFFQSLFDTINNAATTTIKERIQALETIKPDKY